MPHRSNSTRRSTDAGRLRRATRTASVLLGAFVVLGSAPLPTAPGGGVMTERERIDELARVERELQAGEPVTLDWKAMAALNYRTGQMPETLKKLNGAKVRVPGFMVPLEDWEQRVTEFILVPFFGACIHVPPPPPNQMAHVLMGGRQKVEVNLWDPVWVIGRLKIENVDSPYGVVGYQLTAERLQSYDG
jgi:uncharacterized protein